MNPILRYYYLNMVAKSNILENPVINPGKRVCILQVSTLEDACILVSVLLKLENDFDLVVKDEYVPFFKDFFPDSIICGVPANVWSKNELKEKLSDLNERDYPVVFSLTPDSYGVYISTFIAAIHRIGLVERDDYFSGINLYDNTYEANKNEHYRARFKKLFMLRGYKSAKVDIRDIPKTDENENCVLIHPGGDRKTNWWSGEKYIELAKKLSSFGKKVKILLGKEDKELQPFFEENQKKNKFQIVNYETVSELMKIIKSAGAVIGNDAAPVHMAAAYDKKTVCIWGAGDLLLTKPSGTDVNVVSKPIDCRPCDRYHASSRCESGEAACLAAVTVNEVYSTYKKIAE